MIPIMARNQRLKGSTTKLNVASPRYHGSGRASMQFFPSKAATNNKTQPAIMGTEKAGPEYLRLNKPAAATVIHKMKAAPHHMPEPLTSSEIDKS